jgi:hypothetical protein
VIISGYYINGYQWFTLHYKRLLMATDGAILLMDVGGYFINGYW